jgi:ketosteroid isomerase-like protein
VLRQLDVIIDTAVSERDAATLGGVLADDFVYTHSNGRSQTKAEYVGAITGREQPPRRVLNEIQVELHGDIAVTRGNLDIEYADDRPNLYMRYVRVYRLADHHWRAISHRTVYATDRAPSA